MVKRTRIYITLAVLGLLSLPAGVIRAAEAEAARQAQPSEELNVIEKQPGMVQIPSRIGGSRLRGWYVLDSSNLVVELDNGEEYKVTLMNPCPEIRFSEDLGFDTQGPFVLDRWTTIYTDDGRQCYVKELSRYTPEPDDS